MSLRECTNRRVLRVAFLEVRMVAGVEVEEVLGIGKQCTFFRQKMVLQGSFKQPVAYESKAGSPFSENW